MKFTAVGQLVFRLNGDEFRLTAVGADGDPRFAVWFKDRTNGVTTYRGYRVIRPQFVEDGTWTAGSIASQGARGSIRNDGPGAWEMGSSGSSSSDNVRPRRPR